MDFQEEAGEWASDTSAQASGAAAAAGAWAANASADAVGGAVGSFESVRAKFEEASGLLETGLGVILAAVGAARDFAGHLAGVAADFRPLEPVFASPGGIVPLIASGDNMRALVRVLEGLLDSSVRVLDIGDSLRAVSSALEGMRGALGEELALLQSRLLAPGRRLLELGWLLDGLRFDELATKFADFGRRARELAAQLQSLERALSPLLDAVGGALGAARRLGALGQFREDRQEYVSAILSVVPTWQRVEALVIDACDWSNAALQEAEMLSCRVQNFVEVESLPGLGFADGVRRDCAAASVSRGMAACPAAALSGGVEDFLAETAGVLGWIAVSVEYTIRHSTVLRVLAALALLAQGLTLAFFGHRWRRCGLCVEGFCAGVVLWSLLLTVAVVVAGACRGDYVEECSGRASFALVLLLSCGCAMLAVAAQTAQVFLFGAYLGALLGAILYVAASQDRVLDAFLDVDSARAVAEGLLVTTVLSGLALGVATAYFSRAVIIVATSVVGAFVAVASILLVFARRPHWPDAWLWAILALVAALAQEKCTSPAADAALHAPWGGPARAEEGTYEESVALAGPSPGPAAGGLRAARMQPSAGGDWACEPDGDFLCCGPSSRQHAARWWREGTPPARWSGAARLDGGL